MATVSDSTTLLQVTPVPNAVTVLPTNWSLADLSRRLGDIPLERIRLFPPLGTAREEDAVAVNERKEGLVELVDGILVEKAIGFFESRLAAVIIGLFERFLDEKNVGIVSGADGMLRTIGQQVRMPYVAFIRWDRLPDGKLPRQAVLPLAPDLAIEVLSEGDTPAEMNRKVHEYFQAGTRLVWIIDPRTQSATSYSSPEKPQAIDPQGSLDGGEVLPGFQLSLADLFAKAGPRQ